LIVPGIWADEWSIVKNTAFLTVSNLHWEVSCPDIVGGSCDSQNAPRDSDMFWEWKRYSDNLVPTTSKGMLHNMANGGNPLNTTTGAWTQDQVYHTITYRFKNRTNTSTADGALQVWIDGTEITTDTTMSSKPIVASMSSDADDYGINFIRLVDNQNGLTYNIPDSPGYMDLFIDEVKIATSLADFEEGTTTTGQGGSGTASRR